MTDKPYFMHVEDVMTEHALDEMIKLAEQIKVTREVTRKEADSIHHRMHVAGYIRRQWKEIEETLPALMAEAREDRWTVTGIAETLDVTESYVYRRLRESAAE
ncbi:hypothetical protein [Streptomyces sp. NBC_00199]|uniref:hypothetical protein n=1 Tax=Streptomyces sp. NBC_00199 TaxID=2975678 RepID=UPI00224D2161|nr:hypothetical protein [Streptomyces sp. NBC_00199]MCX5266071.1 hypothetical protein [Streptomyces sp. NBC_00199]